MGGRFIAGDASVALIAILATARSLEAVAGSNESGMEPPTKDEQ